MVYLGLHRGVFCDYCYIWVRVRDPRRGAMDAHHSDGCCWAARGRTAQEESAAGRASARSVDSGAYVKQAEHADGTGRPGRWWCWTRRHRGTPAAAGAGRVMGTEERRDQSGPPDPIGIRPPPETPTKGRRIVGTPAGVEKVPSEDSVAFSCLVRWSGSAALLGGLSTTFVVGLFPSHYPPNDGE
jgi:hypothetical protein